jgi:glycosyltransferase involved in cell wall biosynthesis
MKTILASVYAVNPFKGSEDGTGWNLILQIARHNKVIAVTRKNNQPDIEKYLQQNQVADARNIQFEYYDLPYWMRFWKRGSRGALLYYYLWQIGLPGFVKKRKLHFDITHNLNFHNDWTPSFLWRFDKPFVWGPIGHHPQIPKLFILPVYGKKKWLADTIRWKAKSIFWYVDPFLNQTKKKAAKIFAINSDVNKKLNVSEGKLILMPAVATNDMRLPKVQDKSFHIISVGRFVALKGFDVTINAFAKFLYNLPVEKREQVKLTLVGNGPELPLMNTLISELKIGDHVEVIPWIQRDALKELYSQSKVFFFPSHEGAGMVVPEALSCALPVLCFDNAGPGEFINSSSGIKIPYRTYADAIQQFAEALLRLFNEPILLARLSAGARKQFEDAFQWDKKGDVLKNIYEDITHQKTERTTNEKIKDYSRSFAE